MEPTWISIIMMAFAIVAIVKAGLYVLVEYDAEMQRRRGEW